MKYTLFHQPYYFPVLETWTFENPWSLQIQMSLSIPMTLSWLKTSLGNKYWFGYVLVYQTTETGFAFHPFWSLRTKEQATCHNLTGYEPNLGKAAKAIMWSLLANLVIQQTSTIFQTYILTEVQYPWLLPMIPLSVSAFLFFKSIDVYQISNFINYFYQGIRPLQGILHIQLIQNTFTSYCIK